MMWLKHASLIFAALAISGCFERAELLSQPDMAIAPGYIKLDSGKQIQVIGYERCPDSGYSMVGRVEAENMEKHCTVVGRNVKDFEISVGTSVGVVVERWTVVAGESSIKLVRPDGDGATVFRLAE